MSRPKALIFGRNHGAPYHPLAAIEAEVISIFSAHFEVATSDRGENLLALGPRGIDLVVGLDDRWTEPLDRRLLDPVEAWVRAGGTLLLIHNGICWARDDRWRRLAGGRFTGHGPARDLVFSHKAGERFTLWEEPYRFSIPLMARTQVLATYEDEGRRWPAVWTKKVGRGRIGYALPGHSVEAFRQPVYRRWLVTLAEQGQTGSFAGPPAEEPDSSSHNPEGPPPQPRDLGPPAILIVDDEPIILLVLRDELESHFGDRFRYETAENADQGFRTLQRLAQEQVPVFMVLSDWQMPGIKGDEFLTKVRRGDRGIKTIMITGYAGEEVRARVEKEGVADRILLKPWTTEDLVATVEHFVG